MRRREFIAGLGGAAAWPVVARAQQGRVPVIGYLSAAREDAIEALTARFRQGLHEQGYVERQNIEIFYRWAETQYDRLPALAADLVRRRVDVIVTTAGSASARAAKFATTTIPIVFQMGEDPVEAGLVANLNRPGGNITGVTFLSGPLTGKRLELLHEMVPAAKQVGYLVNPTNSLQTQAQISQSEKVARLLGLRLIIQNAGTSSEIEGSFETLVRQGIGALVVDNEALFFNQRDQLVALAARHGVPATFHAREFVEAGGLMSYGATFADAYRLAGTYASRILKGDKPGDLPVQQVTTKVELIINLRTANALGLTIPETLLATADEVIR
jgi:putative tryptophan/tyrosine transport system substrate-binding protein